MCAHCAESNMFVFCLQLAAANLWAEIDDKDSLWRPYLDALPSEDEMVCPLVFMPPEYLPLLANDKAVSANFGCRACAVC